MDFTEALALFITAINKKLEEHSKIFENLTYGQCPDNYFQPISVTIGKKRARIVSNNFSSKSVYCFVDLETGDILKASSWAIPAKGKRGNIFDTSTYEDKDLAVTGWLYR